MRVAAHYQLQPTNYSVANSQSGQSLIETIVALFVLTTGLAAGLALAIYAFGSSSEISERISAAGLAREGIEAVRRMRDTNWRSDALADCGSAQFCYQNWLTSPYDIRGTQTAAGLVYRIVFNPDATTNKWIAVQSGPGDDYRLYQQSAGGLSHNNVPGAGAVPTNFFRKVSVIYSRSDPPYSVISPLVLVRSAVWWYGKTCNNTLTYLVNPSDTNCKLISEEYLTNWRNY